MEQVQTGPRTAVDLEPEKRIVLQGVTWEQFEGLLASLGDCRGVRLAYLDGALEIMSPSRRHENRKTMLARLLELYTLEKDIFFTGYGSTTFRRRAKARGVEPDECYVFTSRAGRRLDAPDLAIEVVLSHWEIDKLSIYAGLGVRELWLLREDGIDVLRRRGTTFRAVSRSGFLPEIDLALLMRFVDREDHTRAVREYRTALRG